MIWDVTPYQQIIKLSYTGQTASAVDGLTVRNPVWRTKTSNKSSKHHYCLISTATTTHYFLIFFGPRVVFSFSKYFPPFPSFLKYIESFHISSYSGTYQLSTRSRTFLSQLCLDSYKPLKYETRVFFRMSFKHFDTASLCSKHCSLIYHDSKS